jgi:hypothetical protein
MGGLDFKAALFWLLVGIPLAWGVWNTVEKALVLFRLIAAYRCPLTPNYCCCAHRE